LPPYYPHCVISPLLADGTRSSLTTAVKQRRAQLVLGWGAAWEDSRVMSAFSLTANQTKPQP
jgi:hypothetical protein